MNIAEDSEDEFQVLNREETDKAFAYEWEDLGDSNYAVHTFCQLCRRMVVGINHTPSMFTVTLSHDSTGQIWINKSICQECAYNFILSREKNDGPTTD